MRRDPRPSSSVARWLRRGALLGLAVGLGALVGGAVLSWRQGDASPLDDMLARAFYATAPLSFLAVPLPSLLPAPVAGWFSLLLHFVLLPAVQGALLAALLWGGRALRRRRVGP